MEVIKKNFIREFFSKKKIKKKPTKSRKEFVLVWFLFLLEFCESLCCLTVEAMRYGWIQGLSSVVSLTISACSMYKLTERFLEC